MINCKVCKRTTEKREPTGHLTHYYKWKDSAGKIHKDIKRQTISCSNCIGKVLLK